MLNQHETVSYSLSDYSPSKELSPDILAASCAAALQKQCHDFRRADKYAGSDRFTPPKQAACPPAVTPVNPPVPIPDFQGVETMEGTPMSLDDLLGDFAVVVTVDAKDPEVAQQVLDRLLQVIEGIGKHSHPLIHNVPRPCEKLLDENSTICDIYCLRGHVKVTLSNRHRGVPAQLSHKLNIWF